MYKMLFFSFFFLLYAQVDHQGDLFGRCGGYQEGCYNRVERYPKRILPAIHRSVAEKFMRFEVDYFEQEAM